MQKQTTLLNMFSSQCLREPKKNLVRKIKNDYMKDKKNKFQYNKICRSCLQRLQKSSGFKFKVDSKVFIINFSKFLDFVFGIT